MASSSASNRASRRKGLEPKLGVGMGKGRKVLSGDHARALIKQAIGIIFGDTEIEAEATIELAAIETRHAKADLLKTKPRRLPARSQI